MQAYGKRKRLTGPDGDNAGEPDGVGTQEYLQEEGLPATSATGTAPVVPTVMGVH